MALVKLGAIITDIKGSAGGHTFCRGIGGLTMKNKTNRGGPGSSSTQLVDIIHKYVQNYWALLTVAQRQSWETFAIFKRVPTNNDTNIYLRGYNLFCQYNYYYYDAGFGILTTPSFIAPATSPLTCDIEETAPGTLKLMISRTLDNTKEFLTWYISGIRQPSRRIDFRALRHGGYVSIAVDEINISPRYTELFGYLAETDDYIYVGWTLLNKLGSFIQKEKAVAINVK